MPQNWPSNQYYQSDIVECNHNQYSNMPCAGLNRCHLQRFVLVPTMVPFGGLIKTVVPPGGNILICFYRFFLIIQFVKSIVYLLVQVQCICLDLCFYNIMRISRVA